MARDEEKPDLPGQQLHYALTHPLRARMHAELKQRPASPPELADIIGKPLPLVSYHYGVLDRMGCNPANPADESPSL